MGEVIDLQERMEKSRDNLIASKPWEFRKAEWKTPHFIQMLRKNALKLEGCCRHHQLPPHFTLNGGMEWTIRSLYAYRENEQRMKEVYYLAGLIDCMINQVNPVLRTHLIRDLYKRIFSLKKDLKVSWYGPMDQILLPIDGHFHSESRYRLTLRCAASMKEIYQTIRDATNEMFEILSLEYVFFCPNLGG